MMIRKYRKSRCRFGLFRLTSRLLVLVTQNHILTAVVTLPHVAASRA
jgi:hypothetical protein